VVFSSLSRCHPSSYACHHAESLSIVASAYIFMSYVLAYRLVEGVFLLRGPSAEKKAPNSSLHAENENETNVGLWT
jgi:hypothetical protein